MLGIGDADIHALEIAPPFQYVGGQRFILLSVADAEQHAFVVADSGRRIQRFYWIQFEHYLATAQGAYDYDADSAVAHSGRPFRLQVRRYTAPPAATSDRGALYALFARAGYRPPEPALRVRWIILTAPDRRSELMIIYGEASSATGTPTNSEVQEVVERARAGFRLVPTRGP